MPANALAFVAVPVAAIDPQVAAGVREAVAQSLGVAPDKVTIDARLMADLGAGSLDLLDLVFTLEQRFGVEITRGALEAAARGDMSEEEFAPKGLISPQGRARLAELIPESAHLVVEGLRAREIPTLFTVGTFARIVMAQRAQGAAE